MFYELVPCIQAGHEHSVDLLVEEIIVFPSHFSEDPHIESDDLQVAFICDVGMEGSDDGLLEHLRHDDRLPSDDELRMEVDDIGVEILYLPDEIWRESECDPEIRVEDGRDSLDRKDFDILMGEFLHSAVVRGDDEHVVPTICKLFTERHDTRDDAICRREEGIGENSDPHRGN